MRSRSIRGSTSSTLEWSLSKAREYLGADDPDTKLLLGKESPEALAARLVGGTQAGRPGRTARRCGPAARQRSRRRRIR